MNELTMYREFFDKAKTIFESLDLNDQSNFTYRLGLLGGLFAGANIMSESCRLLDEPKKQERAQTITRKRITAEALKRMQQLADEGVPRHRISDIMGCSISTVSRKLEGYKPKNPNEPPKGTIDWIRELSADGESAEDISEVTGYSESVVKKYMGGDR